MIEESQIERSLLGSCRRAAYLDEESAVRCGGGSGSTKPNTATARTLDDVVIYYPKTNRSLYVCAKRTFVGTFPMYKYITRGGHLGTRPARFCCQEIVHDHGACKKPPSLSFE